MPIELTTRSQAKSFKGEVYSSWRGETKYFKNLKEALAWLRTEYKGKKRVIMYQDTKSGDTRRSGYVFSWRGVDRGENGKPYHYIQEDWVSLIEVNYNPIKKWR